MTMRVKSWLKLTRLSTDLPDGKTPGPRPVTVNVPAGGSPGGRTKSIDSDSAIGTAGEADAAVAAPSTVATMAMARNPVRFIVLSFHERSDRPGKGAGAPSPGCQSSERPGFGRPASVPC